MTQHMARIGFVSTRLKGTDGVSLEVRKWAEVLTRLQHECFFFAGESDWPPERSYVVPEAHFQHPDVLKLSADLFDDCLRTPETSQRIDVLKTYLSSPNLLRCPADREKKYYESEGSSYQYLSMLGGRKVSESFMTQRWGEELTVVMFDYEPFHGDAGTPGAVNYLFADGHVGDLKRE